jgi:hypothetical protein
MNITRNLFILSTLLFSSSAYSQLGYQNFRHIHINGTHMSETQIVNLEQSLGYGVPNGFYWLNETSGEWGYEGSDEVLGTIFTNNAEENSSMRPNSDSSRPVISNDTGTGSAVINPNGCSYVSSGGMTFRSC